MTRRCALRGSPERATVDTLAALRQADAQVLLFHPQLTVSETTALFGRSENPPLWPETHDVEGTGEVWVTTSGSSGEPRIVRLSWSALEQSAQGVWSALGGSPGDRWLCPLPLAHVAGLAVVERCRVGGGEPVFVEAAGSGAEILKGLQQPHVQFASLVPTQLKRLVAALEGIEAPCLKAVLVGGAATPPSLLRRARHAGLPVVCSYGLTEAGSTVAMTAVEDARQPEASGAEAEILPGFEARTIDGELQLRGPWMFRGYVGAEDRSPESWFATGDEAELQGRKLRFQARRGLSFKRGGEWIDPLEVERVLAACPGVLDIAIVPEPDEDLGHRTVGLVVSERAGLDLVGTLDAFCADHLARHKHPARWEFRAELPRSPLGKLLRNQL